MGMKRVVVFLPSEAVKACDTVAQRYGSNRSEVVRLALTEGMPGAVQALQALRAARLVESAEAGVVGVRPVAGARRPGRGRRRKVLDPDQAVSALVDYGRAVREADPRMPEAAVSASVRVHGQVIGVAADDLEDVVLQVLSQLFGDPQVESVADPSQPPE